MPYTIDGSSYREIAERRFSGDDSLNKLENSAHQMPHMKHSIAHTYSKNFGIIQFKADFLQDIKVSDVRDIGHVSLHIQRKGNSMARFRGIKNDQPLAEGQYNLYFSPAFHSDLYFARQTGFEYLAITLQTDYLLSMLQSAGSDIRRISEAFRAEEPFILSPKALPLTPQLNMAIHSLLNTPVADSLSEMFLNGKVAEILALQLSQFAGTSSSIGTSSGISASPCPAISSTSAARLREVYEYIDHHYLSIDSLADAVKHFPVTEHQLKQGLKQQLNTTLYDLIHRKRMQHAMNLLQQTDMNVNEVAWEIGYSNATNFIQAFKRHFATTPRKAKHGK